MKIVIITPHYREGRVVTFEELEIAKVVFGKLPKIIEVQDVKRHRKP